MFYDLYCKLCRQKGVSPTRAALDMGMSKATPTTWKNKGTTPQASQLQKISEYFGVSIDFLLQNDIFDAGIDEEKELKPDFAIPPYAIPNPFTRRVPRVGSVACGLPILAEENIEGYDCTPESWRSDFTLICKGDSMAPKIMDGDLVAVRCQPEVERGQIAVVLVDGEEATLKRVYVYPDHIELRAINPDFESMMFFGKDMNRVHVEGLAVGICRRIVN